MFIRACAFDDQVIFYYDQYDNKFIAKGGSLAWRTNNPGLVHSHSGAAIKQGAIGSSSGITIFSQSEYGEKALAQWLYCKKYYPEPLLKLAAHYSPDNPKKVLEKLCELSFLDGDSIICSLSKNEFNALVWSIKKLVGYSEMGNEEFYVLPKISCRFYSKKAGIDLYLVGANEFLTKNEAIHRVEIHQLDAVIVRKKDGNIYLRSRPGHQSQMIHLSEHEYGNNVEFDDVIRNSGRKSEGQCTWGFINGVRNPPSSAEESLELISTLVNKQQVWALINDQKLWGAGDFAVCFSLKLNIKTPIIRLATDFFRFLLDQSRRDSKRSPVVVIAHSQGALICDLALENLSIDERQQIHIFTFGGAAFIKPEKANKNSHNFVSLHDPIPKLASPNSHYLLLRREDFYQQGKGEEELLDLLSTQDADFYLDTRDLETIAEYKKQRKSEYRKQLSYLKNVTVLQGSNSGSWEHSFDISCYQSKLKEVLEAYYK